MDERAGAIREEIEETRRRVGDEVEALSYKTDVGARLDDYVDEKKESVRSSVAGAKDGLVSAVDSIVPGSGPPRQRLRSLSRTAERNPLGLAVAGVAVGFVAGLLLPTTDVEDEHLGEISDRVKETASEAGHEALERGKDVAQSAMETVRDEGAEHGRELASELKERVQEAGSEEGVTRRTAP
jgi:gas vesicle protein